MAISEQQKKLILDWTRKIHTLEYAHRYESLSKDSLNLWLGLPSIIIASLLGAISSLSLPECPSFKTFLVFIGCIGACAVAVMAGLQTFLKPSELAEKHRFCSTIYEDLRHRLELLLLSDNFDSSQLTEKLNQLKAEWDRLHTPNVSASNWTKAKQQVTSLKTYPESLKVD
jgi:hypothetical protein